MAHTRPPFVAYITGTALEWQPEKSSFDALATAMLHDVGGGTDVYDQVYNQVSSAVGGLGAIYQRLHDCIARAISAAQNFDAIDTSSTDAQIERVLKAIADLAAPIGPAIGGLALPAAPTATIGPAPAPPPITITAPAGPIGGAPLQEAGQLAGTFLASEAGVAAGGAVAGGAGAGGTLAALVPLLTNPITIIAGVVALVAILAEFIGKGCGPPCIESSKLEQVYEVAADIVGHAVALGMVPFAQWNNLYQAILQHADTAFAQLEKRGDPKAKTGLAHMQQVLSAIHPVAPARTRKYTWLSLLTSWLTMTNTAGWYPDSLQSGENLAQTLLAQMLTH